MDLQEIEQEIANVAKEVEGVVVGVIDAVLDIAKVVEPQLNGWQAIAVDLLALLGKHNPDPLNVAHVQTVTNAVIADATIAKDVVQKTAEALSALVTAVAPAIASAEATVEQSN